MCLTQRQRQAKTEPVRSKIAVLGASRELSAVVQVIATATAGFMAESFLFFSIKRLEDAMTADLIPMAEAAKRAGVSTATIRRRIAAGEFPVYASGFNRRERLVRVEDLSRYGEPRLIAPRQSSDHGDRLPAA